MKVPASRASTRRSVPADAGHLAQPNQLAAGGLAVVLLAGVIVGPGGSTRP